jgi:hypothetical protein
VLLVALVLGLSSAIPAKDVPETPYDESESLPYDSTPLFSIESLQQAAGTNQAVVNLDPSPFNPASPTTGNKIRASLREKTVHPFSDTLTIRHHSLRC